MYVFFALHPAAKEGNTLCRRYVEHVGQMFPCRNKSIGSFLLPINHVCPLCQPHLSQICATNDHNQVQAGAHILSWHKSLAEFPVTDCWGYFLWHAAIMARAGRHFQFAFRGAPSDVPITVHTLCLFKYVMKLFHMECFRLPEGVLSGHLCAEAPRLSRKVVIKGNLAEMFNLTAVLPNKFGVRWADALWRGHCKPIKVRNVCVMARLGSSI